MVQPVRFVAPASNDWKLFEPAPLGVKVPSSKLPTPAPYVVSMRLACAPRGKAAAITTAHPSASSVFLFFTVNGTPWSRAPTFCKGALALTRPGQSGVDNILRIVDLKQIDCRF